VHGAICSTSWLAAAAAAACHRVTGINPGFAVRGGLCGVEVEYKVTAVHILMATCFSAVNFANYVEYKLHYLALSISTVNHATAPSIMGQCRC
jgi:hypothetical protein